MLSNLEMSFTLTGKVNPLGILSSCSCQTGVIFFPWIKIPKYRPNKTFIVFIPQTNNRFFSHNPIWKRNISPPFHRVIINSMYFKINYLFKIPSTSILLVGIYIFKNIVCITLARRYFSSVDSRLICKLE